jgi:hypothetical protein
MPINDRILRVIVICCPGVIGQDFGSDFVWWTTEMRHSQDHDIVCLFRFKTLLMTLYLICHILWVYVYDLVQSRYLKISNL